jgi:hypothetical protein
VSQNKKTSREADETISEPVKLSFDHYGLPVYKTDDGEFAVADDADQADKAAREAIEGSLWAFNADFIVRFVSVNSTDREALMIGIRAVQEKCCEDANPLVRALVASRMDDFVEAAIGADGRGHFLNGYHSREYRGDDIHPTLTGKLAYRIN